MAAGRLAEPGTEYGPCAEQCEHVDCNLTREDSKRGCYICHREIGYGVRFYRTVNEVGSEWFGHADCVEDEAERRVG